MKEYKVSLVDLMAFLENLNTCKDNDVDCNRTAEEYRTMLESTFLYLKEDILESLLCYCNFNNEDGIYTHPHGDPLARMVSRILGPTKSFCLKNNYVIEKKEK